MRAAWLLLGVTLVQDQFGAAGEETVEVKIHWIRILAVCGAIAAFFFVSYLFGGIQ